MPSPCTACIALAALFLAACSGTDPLPQASGGTGNASPGNSGSGSASPGGTGTGGMSAIPNAGGVGTGGSTLPGGGQPPTAGGTGMGGFSGGSAPIGGAAGGGGSEGDALPPRPINVQGDETVSLSFNGQSMFINKSKPIMGKLVLLLGGICTGTGAGGFESFVKQYGFHVFAPKTDTCVNSAPEEYKTAIKANPMDPEANRQVADARMELWDGMDRVDWVDVGPGQSIVEQTLGAIKFGDSMDPGSDWGFFLNADGTLRTSDVYVVGYSWGSQAWAMMSSYVRFGRVIVTSGPASEGFPNAAWITHPAATPAERKFMLVGLKSAYPSMDNGDSGDMEKFSNVLKAGWVGPAVNYTPGSMAAVTAGQNLFAMIGSNNASPGGHTVFCNDNPMNGWLPVCQHVLGVE